MSKLPSSPEQQSSPGSQADPKIPLIFDAIGFALVAAVSWGIIGAIWGAVEQGREGAIRRAVWVGVGLGIASGIERFCERGWPRQWIKGLIVPQAIFGACWGAIWGMFEDFPGGALGCAAASAVVFPMFEAILRLVMQYFATRKARQQGHSSQAR
jgi:hypothetical protein